MAVLTLRRTRTWVIITATREPGHPYLVGDTTAHAGDQDDAPRDVQGFHLSSRSLRGEEDASDVDIDKLLQTGALIIKN